MHETSLAFSILDSAQRLVGRNRIDAVKIAVGELSSVEPELLVFAWEAIVKDGPHEGSRLDVDFRRARQHCRVCGEDKVQEDVRWILACPDCGNPLQVEGGNELDILEITYTED